VIQYARHFRLTLVPVSYGGDPSIWLWNPIASQFVG
jgi:hypothetical protein